jgi:excisionase family DNA binding protein
VAPEQTIALDINQVAELLGVSAWLIRKMIQQGELRHVRLGQLIRVPRSEVDRFLESRVEDGQDGRPVSG